MFGMDRVVLPREMTTREVVELLEYVRSEPMGRQESASQDRSLGGHEIPLPNGESRMSVTVDGNCHYIMMKRNFSFV